MYQILAQGAMSAFASNMEGKAIAARAGDAAFEQVSREMANRFRAHMRMDAALKNIAAVRQDTITANTRIKEAQAEAEANAKVAAAFAGVEGGSVLDVEYQTEVSAALKKDEALRKQKQEEQNLVNQVYGAAYSAAQQSPLPKIAADYSGTINMVTDMWNNQGGKEAAGAAWDKFKTSFKKPQSTPLAMNYRPQTWSIA